MSIKTSLGMRCGQCVHLKNVPYNSGKTCFEMGVESFKKACPDFTPNIQKIRTAIVPNIQSLGYLIKDLNPTQLKLFAVLIANSGDLQKHTGFKFGQPVYINLSSPRAEYVDAYFKAIVLGLTKDKKYLQLTSEHSCGNIVITTPIDSVLSSPEFKDTLKKLKSAKKLVTPRGKGFDANLSKIDLESYRHKESIDLDSIPTIDSYMDAASQSHIFNTGDGRKTKKKVKAKKASTFIIASDSED